MVRKRHRATRHRRTRLRRSLRRRRTRRLRRQRGGSASGPALPKIAVITAIFGDYDTLKEPTDVHQREKVDWFCFTDSKTAASSLWKIDRTPYHLQAETAEQKEFPNSFAKIQDPRTRNMMSAKYYKLQTHKVPPLQPYQYYIWIDGSITLRPTFLDEMLKWIQQGKRLVNFKHPDRSKVEDEMKFSLDITKYKSQPIEKQLAAYKAEGFPDTQGLFENTISCRKNDPAINAVFDEWWLQNLKWTYQDQISYTYSLWKHKQMPDHVIHEKVFDNKQYSYLNKDTFGKHINWSP